MTCFDDVHGKLGFGLMRLPKIDGEIDIPQFGDMVDAFLDAGFNYFDTAWAYPGSEEATRKALPDAYAVLDRLNDELASMFATTEADPFGGEPACVLFVGINGAGKTTTVGKLAKEGADAGRKVILGSADTFRAAAIAQLEEWSRRANVPIVER